MRSRRSRAIFLPGCSRMRARRRPSRGTRLCEDRAIGPLVDATPRPLPARESIQSVMAMGTYEAFQFGLEAGHDVVPAHGMHNMMHTYFGTGTQQMASLMASPFDPMFYLHHCNIDRLWAMWQMDGHATAYGTTAPRPGHAFTDLLYPWVGGAPGYSTNHDMTPIAMPDFSAQPAQTPAGLLDHRALGYSYDSSEKDYDLPYRIRFGKGSGAPGTLLAALALTMGKSALPC